MPGINQLPPGSEGAAALSLIYASVSLLCSSTLLWLTIAHREGWSYIALLAGSTLVSTVGSISQQIHDVFRYEEVIREQFDHRAGASHNPEVAIANGSVGLDLGLYYIQYYLYNVQSLLVLFWAGELAQSVYGLGANTRKRQILRRVNLAGKAISFLLPLTTILMLRSPMIQKNYIGFILVADLPLMISLAIGSGLICAILTRYIRTKKKITNWSDNNQRSADQSEAGASTGSTLYSSSTGKPRNNAPKQKGFHDRWLMVRFFVSFIMLAIFEVTNTLFQVQSTKNVKKDAQLTEPDMSAERARSTFFLFLPGTTAGIALFIVFGTTSSCRSKICETFVPRSMRRFEPSSGWKLSWRGDKSSGADGDATHGGVGARRSQIGSVMPKDGDDLEMAVVSKNDHGDAIRVTRSIHIHHDDLMKPLPTAPPKRAPMSRFANLRDYPPHESLDRDDDYDSKDGGIYSNSHPRSPSQSSPRGITHYVSSSDSDDALPILPIMPSKPKSGQ